VSHQLSIIIPTYNEAERIGSTLDELSKYLKKEKIDAEVIVADASSPDGTAKVVKKHSKDFKSLSVYDAGAKPPGKFIKGLQVKKGMLQADGDVVLFMDADLATPLKYINEALSQINSGNDLSICVRNLQKSHKGLRKLISGFGNFLVQLLLLPGINDTQCGFKAFTRESVKVIFPLQTIDGWGFDMEVLAIARKKGYHIGLMNVPDWKDVTKGSKISGSSPIKASLQTFGDLLKIRWQIIRGKYKH
jgi:dolichyl-phosphate beta-glucosyltransferase